MKNHSFSTLLLAVLVSLFLWSCKPQVEGEAAAPETAAVSTEAAGTSDAKTSLCAKTFAAAFAQCYATQNQAMEEYYSCYNPLREEEKKLNKKCEALCETALKTNDEAAWKKCTQCQITITPSLTELHSKMRECTDSIMALISRRLHCSKEASDNYASCLNQ